MFVVAVLSIFAAISFRKMMDEKGYDGKRVSWYPIISGAAVILLGYVLKVVAKRILGDEPSMLLTVYPLIIDVLSVLIHGAFVAKLWRQIKKLPSQNGE